MVRAKFKVDDVKNVGGGFSIKLSPVMTGSDENKEFFKYTPWGSIEIGVVNESAATQFEVGKEYYVDFTSA